MYVESLFQMIMENSKSEFCSQTATQPENLDNRSSVNQIENSVPTSRRKALDNVRRQLTDEELSSPGVQKLLLDMLEELETERDSLKSYVSGFHETDKKAAILGEKLSADKIIDVYFGVGVGLGGAILGLAPFFGSDKPIYGVLCALVGLILIVVSSIGRVIK